MGMLKLTVVVENSDMTHVLEVDSHETTTFLRDLISTVMSLSRDRIELYFNGKEMPAGMTLKKQHVGDHDIVLVREASTATRRFSSRRVDTSEVEAQRYIEKSIRQRNVLDNMQQAIENSPESFAKVLMLYVPISIGSRKIAAFVDSGAQSTIMSATMVEKCGLKRLVDERFAGVAVGVGSARILGRIHQVEIKMGHQKYMCSVTVLDDKSGNMEFLLGLDMLKRHQCMIDLKNDCLHIGEEVVPFLPENMVPHHAKLTSRDEVQMAKAAPSRRR